MAVGDWRGFYVIVMGCAMRQRARQRLRGSHQTELAKLPAHLFRHQGRALCHLIQIARSVLRGEVAPALKGTVGPWCNEDYFGIEHQRAASDALFVNEGPHRKDALAAHDFAADHPIERAAVDKFVRALGHHARGVDALRLFAVLPFLLELFLDPVLEIADRVTTDAELDEMEWHASIL